jgi:hypothetical protein
LPEGYILRGRKDAFQDALAGPLGCELKARAMNTQMGGGVLKSIGEYICQSNYWRDV